MRRAYIIFQYAPNIKAYISFLITKFTPYSLPYTVGEEKLDYSNDFIIKNLTDEESPYFEKQFDFSPLRLTLLLYSFPEIFRSPRMSSTAWVPIQCHTSCCRRQGSAKHVVHPFSHPSPHFKVHVF